MGCVAKKPTSDQNQLNKHSKQVKYTLEDLLSVFNLSVPIQKAFNLNHPSQLQKGEVKFVELRCQNSAEQRIGFKVRIPNFEQEHYAVADTLRRILSLQHPFIQKNIGVYKHNENYILVREQQSGFNIIQYFQETKIKQQKISRIFECILQGMSIVHSKQVFHGQMKYKIRNLNVDSLMFSSLEKNQMPILVGYGLCELTNDDENPSRNKTQLQDVIKNPNPKYYCKAPEVLKGQVEQKSDVWSLGVILYRCVVGSWPFEGETKDKIKQAIVRGVVDFENHKLDNVSSEIKKFIQLLLTYRAKERPTAQECLKNSWFTSHKEALSKKDQKRLKRTMVAHKPIKCENKLQHVTLMLLADISASKKEHERMMNTFRKLDVDNNGTLSKAEIYNGLITVMSEAEAKQQVDEVFKQGDFDGQGEIDFNEYMMIFTKTKKLATKKKISKIFRSADVDGSGTLSISEVRQMLVKLNVSNEEIDEMVKQFDVSGDGNISEKEFVEAILKNLKMDADDDHKSKKSKHKKEKVPPTDVVQDQQAPHSDQQAPHSDQQAPHSDHWEAVKKSKTKLKRQKTAKTTQIKQEPSTIPEIE